MLIRQADILHVTDCFNAGVGQVIEEIAQNSGNHSIALLWDSHFDSPVFTHKKYTRIHIKRKWQSGPIRRISHLRHTVAELNPAVIHAHSSIAGFYVRLFVHGRTKVYSPHCFSFDRLDINIAIRLTFYITERFLHLFTSYYVANWPIEALEVAGFRPRKNIFLYRPESTTLQMNSERAIAIKATPPIFIGVGRIRPQKDPIFFSEVASQFNKLQIADFIWVGGGDLESMRALTNAGVTIIPWASRSELAKFYSKATATLITSAWESGPLTMFESLNHSTPVILRSTKSAKTYNIRTLHTVEEFVSECINMSKDDFDSAKAVLMQKKLCEDSFRSILNLPRVALYSEGFPPDLI